MFGCGIVGQRWPRRQLSLLLLRGGHSSHPSLLTETSFHSVHGARYYHDLLPPPRSDGCSSRFSPFLLLSIDFLFAALALNWAFVLVTLNS